MPSTTLLEYTQDILSAMDSDEVNSISDTVESMQVARIIRRAYDAISSRADLVEHYTLFELTASGDNAKPTLMYRPNEVLTVDWLKYNKETTDDVNMNFQEVIFLPLDTFLSQMHQIKEDDDNVIAYTITINSDTIEVLGYDDKAPTYWTAVDDDIILFDSYDAEVDTTLQKSKTLGYGKKDQSFTMSDSFVPFLDRDFSTLLLNEATTLAFAELKQVPHEIANKMAMRMWTKTSKAKRGLDNQRKPIDDVVNYGRR